VEEHCSNPQCFKEKNYEAKLSTSSILKIIKSIKTILKKIITKKIIWGNTVAIHNVLKRKTTKLNSQPAQYEKKIDKDNFGKKNKKKSLKNKKKTMWGNTVEIHSVLKKKNYKAILKK
jgi:hypothetical protein